MVLFFGILVVVLAVTGGLFLWWRKKVEAEIAEGAEIEWAHFQKNEPEFLGALSKEHFQQIYSRVHMPRFPGYALAAFATFIASLPISLAVLTIVLWGAEKTGVIPQPAELADRLLLNDGEVRFFKHAPPEAALYYIEDLAGFYYFFGMLFIWLCIVAFYMHRYHARRPGYLRDEIIRRNE